MTPRGSFRVALLGAHLLVGVASAGELHFRSAEPFPFSGSPADLALADCNGDGRADVLVTNFDLGTLGVFLNTGNGDLVAAGDVPVALTPNRMAPGDVDADGHLDVIVAETESDNVYLLRGRGDGTFGDSEPIRFDGVEDHDPAGVFLADMNRDGRPDVVVSFASEAGGRVNVLLGNGDGTFDYDPARGRRLSAQSEDVAAGDLDGDGDPDVVAPSVDGNLGVLLGNGAGGLDRVQIVAAGQALLQVQLADIDGNGALDVLANDPASLGLRLLRGNGAGGFAASEFVPVGPSPATLRLADVDRDGVSDAITANPSSGDVSVLLGESGGTFGKVRHYLAPDRPFAADAVDVDGDGRLDLVAASQVPFGGAVNLLRGTPEGFAAVEALLQEASITAATTRDIDGDAVPELVLANTTTRTIVTIARDPRGGFLPPRTAVPGIAASAVQLGDLNGDGRLDVVATPSGETAVVSALQLADGTFSPALTSPLATTPATLALADFNRDGTLDAVLSSTQPGAPVSVLIGQGDGRFSFGADLPVEGDPSGLATGDYNGDGHADLFVGNSNRAALTIFAGTGHGGFNAPLLVPTAGPPLAFDAADLDADGNLDLVYASFGAVRTLLGDGTGDFSPGATLSARGLILGLTLRDLTGDLRPDVAVVSQTDNAFVAFANTGSRTSFGRPVTVALGQRPFLLTTADLDADGRYDAVAVGSAVWALTNDGATPALRGDGNGDGRLGAADLTAFMRVQRAAARRPVEAAGPGASAGVDANGDGWIDGDDLPLVLRKIFAAGATPPSPGSVSASLLRSSADERSGRRS